MVSCGAVIPR